jgi:hypothetical protein
LSPSAFDDGSEACSGIAAAPLEGWRFRNLAYNLAGYQPLDHSKADVDQLDHAAHGLDFRQQGGGDTLRRSASSWEF